MEEKKLVPKRRFEGFLESWEYISFGAIADIVRGASPRPIEDPRWFDFKSDVGWLRISDVTKQNGKIYFLEQKISKLGQSRTRVLHRPHLLLSIAATVGKPVINYVKTGVHDGFLIFLKPKFDIEYMYQWLEWYRDKWEKYGQPGSQVNLNSDLIKNHNIFLPSLKEQQKIGKFFRVLDERIANQERKIAKVKALKEAYLAEMFPQEGETVPKRRFKGFKGEWDLVKLEDIANTYSGGTPLVSNRSYYLGDIPFIRSGEINSSSTKYFINENAIKNSSARLVKKGNLLYALYGATSGEVSISKINGAINQAVLAIVLKKGYNSYYLLQWLRLMKEKIITTQLQGGQGNLSGEIIRNQIIKLPSFQEQQKIGAFFKNLDDQIEAEEAKLEKLKQMKEAYLEEMFV